MLFVDAHDGSLVEQFTGIAHALDRRVYEVDTDDFHNCMARREMSFPGVIECDRSKM